MKKEDRNCCSAGFSVKNCFVFFLLFLCQTSFGQTPNYTHDPVESRDLDYFTVTATDALNPDAKINRLIVAIDITPDQEILLLTYGNGIKKVGTNGGLDDFIPNQNNRLSNPLDFAINSEGKIFVATNESDRRFIRVYAPDGTYLPNETLGDGAYGSGANRFRGPVGLTFDDEDNLYVADHYIGNSEPPVNPSFIKIYHKDNSGSYRNNLIKEFDKVGGEYLNFPYRLAVNSQGHLYMAELGQNNNPSVRVLQFDNNFNPTQIDLIDGPELGAPGSIIIDKFDNIFIADFGDNISLARVLKATDDIDEFYSVFEIIRDGIKDNLFNINIYNPDNSYRDKISTKIDFPIDFTISDCGELYVDNSIFDGEIKVVYIPFLGNTQVPDISIDFDLEAYQRSSGYDKTPPEAICVSDFEITLNSGETATITAEEIDNGSYDLCGEVTLSIDKSEFTSADAGDNLVTLTVTDEQGNESTCTTIVKIIAEQTPPEAICRDMTVELDENGQATITAEQIYGGTENLDLSINKNTFSCNDVGQQTVTLTVKDPDTDLTDSCEATVTVRDNIDPVFSTCPAPVDVIIQEGEVYKIPNFVNDAVASDNCGNLTISQNIAAGTEITTDQTLTVTLTATDASNNTATCTVDVKVTVQKRPFGCKPAGSITLQLNAGGQARLQLDDVIDITGDITGYEFDWSQQNFNCEDAGKVQDVTLSFTNGDDSGECLISVEVLDSTDPVINCPGNRTVTIPAAGSYSLPDFTQSASASDNCDISGITQDPLPGTGITSDTTVKLTAEDSSGNIADCSFTISVVTGSTIQLDCPGDYEISPNNNCEYIVPDFKNILTFSPSEASIQQSIAAGTILYYDEDQNIEITATYEGQEESCMISLVLVDDPPVLVCPSDQNISVAEGESVSLPDYKNELEVYNCGDVDIVQTPAAGTLISEDTKVTFIVTDSAGREVSCSFNVQLVAENTLVVACLNNYEVFANENCTYLVPDFAEILTYSPADAVISQNLEAGSEIDLNSDPYVTVTASYGEQSEECNIYLKLKDDVDPIITCLEDQTVSIAENGSYSIPNYLEQIDTSDNCGNVNLEQSPVVGTEVTTNTTITIRATDDFGNTASCNFNLSVIVEENLAINCPGDKEFSFDENCSFELPDFTDEAEVINGESLEVIQIPAPGTIITDNSTEIELRVEKQGESAACSFNLLLNDNTPPEVICKSDYEIQLDEGETFTLNPADLDAGSFDNCGNLEFSVNQTEFSEADEGTVPVRLTATDEAGNSASCETSITVIVNHENNQTPTANDDNYQTSQGTALNASNSNGILQNDTDPESDQLTAILDNDVAHGTLELDEDGSFTYTPDVDFTGQDFFTYHVSDGTTESGTAMVTITVTPDNSNEFSCAQQIVIGLDEDGQRTLSIEDLYFGNAEGFEISANQLIFTCDDIGETIVTLTYSGRLDGSCEIQVTVVDDTAPVLRLKDISIDLDLEGMASIDFEDIDNGSLDACDKKVTYTLSQTTFSCEDVGENVIEVTAEDSSGNITRAQVTVKVFTEAGICDEPVEGSEYIFIYPNPNSGEFKIATPADISISRIEVFDHRGRFITARTYAENENTYEMELGPLQEAVYVLKLTTNEGEVMKRFIFKN